MSQRTRERRTGCLLVPIPAYPASGQLVLACRDETTPRNVQGATRTSDDTLLVFDFDRDLLFHDRAGRSTPIDAIKKYFITWKSDDGTRAGYLNRVTLEAVEQDGIAKTAYACALYAQLSFKAAEP